MNDIVAIDVGNGYTKLMVSSNDTTSFPSLIRKSVREDGFSHSNKPLKTASGYFHVGEQCLGEKNTERVIDSRFYSSEVCKILFIASLKRAAKSEPLIVTGLPTELWLELKGNFSSNLRKWAQQEGYSPKKIIVLPQHAGPFYDPMLVDELNKPMPTETKYNSNILIFDIGRGTIDIGLFSNGQPKNVSYGGPLGVHSIYREVITSLKNRSHKIYSQSRGKKRITGVPPDFEMRSDMDTEMLDQWVRKGSFQYNSEQYSVRPLVDDECDRYCGTILSKCIMEVPDVRYMDAIVIAGGGAHVIGTDRLRKSFGRQIFVPDNSGYSTLRGFYQYALLCEQLNGKGVA